MTQECITLEDKVDKVHNRTPVRYRGFYLTMNPSLLFLLIQTPVACFFVALKTTLIYMHTGEPLHKTLITTTVANSQRRQQNFHTLHLNNLLKILYMLVSLCECRGEHGPLLGESLGE